MATTSTPAEYREAEQIFARTLGLELTERLLETVSPVGRVRAIEVGAGPPVVYLHGGGGMASQMLPLMAGVSGRRSIAVDRPGCGLTDGFDYTDHPSVRLHAVAFIESVLDALAIDRADLVGNSMGGLWCLWFALDRPDRVHSLALIGCPALVVGTWAPVPMRVLTTRLGGSLLERPQDAKGIDRVMRMMGHDPAALAERFPGASEMSVVGGNLPGAGASFRSLLRRVARLRGARPDCSLDADELAALRVDPLVLWGANDPFGPGTAAERFAQATNGILKTVGAGHIPWLDAPEETAAHLIAHLNARSPITA